MIPVTLRIRRGGGKNFTWDKRRQGGGQVSIMLFLWVVLL